MAGKFGENYFDSRESIFLSKRKSQNKALFHMEALEALSFVKLTLGDDFLGHGAAIEAPAAVSEQGDAAERAVNAFLEYLRNGAALCAVLNVINKQTKIKFKDKAAAGSFQARDNVSLFLRGCSSLGVPGPVLFFADDLVDRKNDRSVITCLLALARVAVVKHGAKPSEMIAAELEIQEEQEAAEDAEAIDAAAPPAAPDTGVEEDDAEAERKRAAIRNRSAKRKGPAPKASANAAAAAAAAAAATAADGGEGGVALEEKQEVAAASGPGANGDIDVPAASGSDIPELTSVVDMGSLGKGDIVDQAIAQLVTKNMLIVTVKKVPAFGKKQQKGKKADQKGKYRIGLGEPVHVRIIQGILMVRVQLQWVPFAEYVEEKMKTNRAIIPDAGQVQDKYNQVLNRRG